MSVQQERRLSGCCQRALYWDLYHQNLPMTTFLVQADRRLPSLCIKVWHSIIADLIQQDLVLCCLVVASIM